MLYFIMVFNRIRLAFDPSQGGEKKRRVKGKRNNEFCMAVAVAVV